MSAGLYTDGMGAERWLLLASVLICCSASGEDTRTEKLQRWRQRQFAFDAAPASGAAAKMPGDAGDCERDPPQSLSAAELKRENERAQSFWSALCRRKFQRRPELDKPSVKGPMRHPEDVLVSLRGPRHDGNVMSLGVQGVVKGAVYILQIALELLHSSQPPYQEFRYLTAFNDEMSIHVFMAMPAVPGHYRVSITVTDDFKGISPNEALLAAQESRMHVPASIASVPQDIDFHHAALAAQCAIDYLLEGLHTISQSQQQRSADSPECTPPSQPEEPPAAQQDDEARQACAQLAMLGFRRIEFVGDRQMRQLSVAATRLLLTDIHTCDPMHVEEEQEGGFHVCNGTVELRYMARRHHVYVCTPTYVCG